MTGESDGDFLFKGLEKSKRYNIIRREVSYC